MEGPLVSVIVPNYNHAKYLDERIGSILRQTYQNIEIIILDDKSPDNSVEVIERYRSNPKVSHIVLNEKNSGSTFIQWHRGMELAKGELIWIAESDDTCEPDMLEELVRGYLAHPTCTLLYVLSIFMDGDGVVYGKRLPERKPKFMSGTHFIHWYMSMDNYIKNASSVIFRKDCALRSDRAYMDYKGAGDRLLWIEIAEQGDVYMVNRQLNYFRRHKNVVTTRASLDGTNMKEDKKTYLYLEKKGYLKNPIMRYIILSCYRNMSFKMKLDNEDIRQELYEVWGCTKFNKFPSWAIQWLRWHWQAFIGEK